LEVVAINSAFSRIPDLIAAMEGGLPIFRRQIAPPVASLRPEAPIPDTVGAPKISGKPPNPESIKENSSGKTVKTFSRHYEIMLRRGSLDFKVARFERPKHPITVLYCDNIED